MAERNLVGEVKRWATEEFSLPPHILPNDNTLKMFCVGGGRSIWTFVTEHIFQQRNVKIMRGNLQWYEGLRDKELKKAEGHSEAAKKRELQRKIEQLRTEISHLDSRMSGTEEQLATQESSIRRTWGQVEDNHRRELLLQAFRKRCISEQKVLSLDTQNIHEQCQDLEQMAEKAEIEVLFDHKPSSSCHGDKLNSKAAEPQVLREVRRLCDDRVRFFQSLQESEMKTAHSVDTQMTHKQRTAVFQLWLRTVEDLLGSYPLNHVLSALECLATRQQKELEENISSMDETRDSKTGFHSESNPMSAEGDNDLPSVKILLQAALEEMGQGWVELKHTRARVQQLQNQLQDRNRESVLEIFGPVTEGQNDTMALSSLDEKLQSVMLAAVRNHIRDQCIQLKQQARSQQEQFSNLHQQSQSLLDSRQLMALRQGDIRCLIKGNSSAKTGLIRLQTELQEFIQGKLVPQFKDVTTAGNSLRNCISKEAKQFGMVLLPALDKRTVEGMQSVPASHLSIHRLQCPTFSGLRQSLAFPLYRAPEQLCSQTCSQQLELRCLRQLQQLHSASQEKIQKRAELLRAPDQKALISRIKEEDQKLMEAVLPRARRLTQRCAQGFPYGVQAKTAISDWWEKPAQHVLPEVTQGGLTYQKWLLRWKLAAEAF